MNNENATCAKLVWSLIMVPFQHIGAMPNHTNVLTTYRK